MSIAKNNMWGYRKRLERDLVRWREAGWITEEAATSIRSDIGRNRSVLNAANTLAILSAILIGFGLMSFVAANWQDMPRLLRMGLLVALLWSSYGLALTLFKKKMHGFGQAAILLGVGVFGASIMLISQMYHMHGKVSDAVLLWAGGALLAGALLRSNPALALAMILFSFWGISETASSEAVFWPYLVPWTVVSLFFYLHRWPPGVHLSGITLSGFIVTLGAMLFKDSAYWLVVLVGLVISAIAILGPRYRSDLPRLWSGALNYGIILVFVGLFSMQIFDEPPLSIFVVLAVIILAVALAVVARGIAVESRTTLWLGYIGFSVEVLTVYFKTIGTLLNSSVFFVLSGLVVASLAYLAHRLHVRALQPRGS